ncbi:hypothetical protein D3C87_1342310 [compost metagenome]
MVNESAWLTSCWIDQNNRWITQQLHQVLVRRNNDDVVCLVEQLSDTSHQIIRFQAITSQSHNTSLFTQQLLEFSDVFAESRILLLLFRSHRETTIAFVRLLRYTSVSLGVGFTPVTAVKRNNRSIRLIQLVILVQRRQTSVVSHTSSRHSIFVCVRIERFIKDVGAVEHQNAWTLLDQITHSPFLLLVDEPAYSGRE